MPAPLGCSTGTGLFEVKIPRVYGELTGAPSHSQGSPSIQEGWGLGKSSQQDLVTHMLHHADRVWEPPAPGS